MSLSNPLKIYETTISGYRKINIQNDLFEVGITPELGGKILSFGNNAMDMFFCMDKLDYLPKNIEKESDVIKLRKKIMYLPPGGYKSWLSPQDKWGWPPYIDLEAGTYSCEIITDIDKIEVVLRSSICRESGMIIEKKISIGQKNELSVYEKIENCCENKKEHGIWGVTQLNKEGKVIFPIGLEKQIENLNNKRYEENVEYIFVDGIDYAVVNCSDKNDFKIGTRYSEGWVLTIFEREKIYGYLKRFPKYSEDVIFGHGCAVEIYNSPVFKYFEVETHSPVVKLSKGESTETFEKWSVHTWETGTAYEEIIKKIKQMI